MKRGIDVEIGWGGEEKVYHFFNYFTVQFNYIYIFGSTVF